MAAARQISRVAIGSPRSGRPPRRSGSAPTCRRTISFDSAAVRHARRHGHPVPVSARRRVRRSRSSRSAGGDRRAPARGQHRRRARQALHARRPRAAGRRPASGYDVRRLGLEVRVPVKAGPRVVGVTFVRKTVRARRRRARAVPRAARRRRHRVRSRRWRSVTITGPFDADRRRRHAEPPAHLRVPAGRTARPKRPARGRSSRRSRAAPIGVR